MKIHIVFAIIWLFVGVYGLSLYRLWRWRVDLITAAVCVGMAIFHVGKATGRW